ncbi:uncharacterized protein LOC143359181 [Halictus rubicundus]|uniref:uncharacterized protein LOC143359181 n=1 Tax=Halictus rubicundus TaxID=77578 RepID=UPI0040354D55
MLLLANWTQTSKECPTAKDRIPVGFDFYMMHQGFYMFIIVLARLCKEGTTVPMSASRPLNCDGKDNNRTNGSKRMAYEVFLGGSCNPTTWRSEIAIPTLQSLGITYYNPQVSQWGPELIAQEYEAKQTAKVLLFVIDNQTRNSAGIIEAAQLAATRRESLILVIYPYRQDQTILGEPVSIQEYYDLMNGLLVLQYLMERQRIPIFESVSVALNCTSKVLREEIKVQDLHSEDGTRPVRISLTQNGTDSVTLRDIFKSMDINDTGSVNLAEAWLALQSNVSVSDLLNVVNKSETYRRLIDDGFPAKKDPTELRINFEQFCALARESAWRTKSNGVSCESEISSVWSIICRKASKFLRRAIVQPFSRFLDWTNSLVMETEKRDLYVGVIGEDQFWLETAAKPSIESRGLSLHRPCLNEYNEYNVKVLPQELQKMKNSRLILLIVPQHSRGITIMALAAHLIGLRAKLVLCVQTLPEGCVVSGEKLTEQATKDYNRGRMYLSDYATREGVPVFQNIAEALQHAIQLVQTVRGEGNPQLMKKISISHNDFTHFWSSGKYSKARSVGSEKAASAATNAFLLARKPCSRSPLASRSAEYSTKRKAVFILSPTTSVITMFPISFRSWASDCRVSLAEVSCSIVRTRINASISQLFSFNPTEEAMVTPGINVVCLQVLSRYHYNEGSCKGLLSGTRLGLTSNGRKYSHWDLTEKLEIGISWRKGSTYSRKRMNGHRRWRSILEMSYVPSDILRRSHSTLSLSGSGFTTVIRMSLYRVGSVSAFFVKVNDFSRSIHSDSTLTKVEPSGTDSLSLRVDRRPVVQRRACSRRFSKAAFFPGPSILRSRFCESLTIDAGAMATQSDNPYPEMNNSVDTRKTTNVGGLLVRFLSIYWRSLVIVVWPLVLLPVVLVVESPEVTAMRCLYVVGLMAMFWMTEVLPLPITGLLPVVLYPLMGIMGTGDTCACYMNDTTMMFIGSMVIAIVIENSGLHMRVALLIIKTIGCSHRRLTLGLFFVTMFLSMWISNTAATAMMLPIIETVLLEIEAQGLGRMFVPEDEGCGEEGGANEESPKKPTRTTMVYYLVAAYASSIGGVGTVVGTGTNLTLKGFFEKRFPDSPGISLTSWMLYSVPPMLLMGFLTWLWLQIMYMGMFRPESKDASAIDIGPQGEKVAASVIEKKYKELGPITWHESVVGMLFLLVVLLWFFRNPGFARGWPTYITDLQVKDSTAAAFVILLFFILPSKLDFLHSFDSDPAKRPTKPSPGMINWKMIHQKMHWSLILVLGGGFAISAGSTSSKLSSILGHALDSLQSIDPLAILFIVCLFAETVTELTSNVAVANIILPVLAEMCIAMRLHPLYLMLPAALCCSFSFHLPVGTPPNAIATAAAHIKTRDFAIAGIGPSVITLLITTFAFSTWGTYVFNLSEFPDWAT